MINIVIKMHYLSYRECSFKFPFVNEDMEFSYKTIMKRYELFKKWATNNNIKYLIQGKRPTAEGFLLKKFHFVRQITLQDSKALIWDISKLTFEECTHAEKTDCSMMQDMTTAIQEVQKDLVSSASGIVRLLSPKMTLVGSVAEGTRLILGNEMDVLMEFPNIPEAFEIRNDDPFHVYCTEKTPPELRRFFNEKEQFQLHRFKEEFLTVLDNVIEEIYKEGRNPSRLKRGRWKAQLQSGELTCGTCKRNKSEKSLFQQCSNPECLATVAQVKNGFCLQFEWISDEGEAFYCSIDLVPVFPIKKISPTEVARIINTVMRQRGHPPGWFFHFIKYFASDRIIDGLQNPDITSVVLKTLNCQTDNNYFIRPSQLLGPNIFSNPAVKENYCRIKLLMKARDIKTFGSYMMKKLLLKPEYKDKTLKEILSSDEFKARLGIEDWFDPETGDWK